MIDPACKKFLFRIYGRSLESQYFVTDEAFRRCSGTLNVTMNGYQLQVVLLIEN